MNRVIIGASESNLGYVRRIWNEEEALTKNLEIPIAICIAGVIYFALLYSVIVYLG